MDTQFDDFFESGGIGSFVGRMSMSLGIQSHNMRVVRAYRGSVIVDFFLYDESDDKDSLEQLQVNFIETIQNIGTSLGGPIISFSYGQALGNTVVMSDYVDFVANEQTI